MFLCGLCGYLDISKVWNKVVFVEQSNMWNSSMEQSSLCGYFRSIIVSTEPFCSYFRKKSGLNFFVKKNKKFKYSIDNLMSFTKPRSEFDICNLNDALRSYIQYHLLGI